MQTRKISLMAMFVGLSVILTRILSIQTPVVRISFAFLPMMIAGRKLGIVSTGIVALAADLLGFLLFPPSAPFFIGYTITAVLSGLFYGFLKHADRKNLLKSVVGVVLLITVFNHMFLNSLWTSILLQTSIWAIVPVRMVSQVLMAPIMIFVGYGVMSQLEKTNSL